MVADRSITISACRGLVVLAVLGLFLQHRSFGQQPQEAPEDITRRDAWMLQRYSGGGPISAGARAEAIRRMNENEASRHKAAAARGSSAAILDPQWHPIGPAPSTLGGTVTADYGNASGRVAAIAVDPRNRDVLYAGAASGGVWKSTDAGATWVPLTDFEVTLGTGAIALDPTNPDTIYVGTGEPVSWTGIYGTGVLKSVDGGKTWTLLGERSLTSPDAQQARGGSMATTGLSVSPDGKRILISVEPVLLQDAAVYLSKDGGVSWTKVLPSATAMSVEFVSNTVAYAGVGPGGRTRPGLYTSVDGGETWTQLGTFPALPSDIQRIELGISRQVPNIVYAATSGPQSTNLNGVYKTTDGGATWSKLPVPDFCGPQCFYDMTIAVSPVNPNYVWVGGSAHLDALLRSTDGGQTWLRARNRIHVDFHALAFSSDGSRLYCGNDGGVYSTEDVASGEVNWKNLNSNLQITQFYPYFGMHPTDPRFSIAGSQDNGTSYFMGELAWPYLGCGDGGAAVISATTPLTLYMNCSNGSVEKTESTQRFSTVQMAGVGDSVAFINTMVGDPSNGDTLYFAAPRLYATRDGAKNWYGISDPVAATPDGGVVYAIAVSASNPDVVYLGGSNGVVRRSTNATSAPVGVQAEWVDASAGLPSGMVTTIDVDRATEMSAALTLGGFSPTKVWVTANGGSTWTDITANLPQVPTYAVVIDPDLPATYYVANDIGVFVTRDGGTSWAPLGFGLPRASVQDLKLHRPSRILRASTFGRGMWDAAVPVTYTGPALAMTPGSFRFPNTQIATAAATSVTASNIGHSPLTLEKLESSPGFEVTSHCPPQLQPAESCVFDVSFRPTDAGLIQGTVVVASNTSNGTGRLPVGGYATNPADNDTFAAARWIRSAEFHDRITTLNATGDSGDPAPLCPFSSRYKSVWYRFTASADLKVTVDSAGSDYNTTLSVWTGEPPKFTAVGCSATPGYQLNQFPSITFNATAGTTYSIMATDRNDRGGLLAMNMVAAALPAGPSLNAISPTQQPAGGGSFTLAVSGAGFTSASVVQWDGTAQPTTFVDATRLTATLPGSLLAAPKTAQVTVANGEQITDRVPFHVAGFQLTPVTTAAAVNAGASAKFNIAVEPIVTAFEAPVAFACSGLPSLASCSFSTASLTPGAQKTTTEMTVTTTGPSAAGTARHRSGPGTWQLAVLVFPALAVCLANRKRSRRLLCVAVMLAGMASCGGGRTTPAPASSPTPKTPAGNYTIAVTATSGSYSVTTQVALSVQ